MNILLATDGSECSDVATRFLTRLNLSSEGQYHHLSHSK